MSFLDDDHFGYIKPLFLFLFVFWGISLSTRPLGSYAVGEIALYFHVPMEQFFDGTDQENSKTQRGRGQIKKIQENKKEIMEERKRRDLCLGGGSHTCVFAIGWGCPQATTLVWPSIRRTHSSSTSLTTSQDWKKNTAPPVLLINPCIQVTIQAIVSSFRNFHQIILSKQFHHGYFCIVNVKAFSHSQYLHWHLFLC